MNDYSLLDQVELSQEDSDKQNQKNEENPNEVTYKVQQSGDFVLNQLILNSFDIPYIILNPNECLEYYLKKKLMGEKKVELYSESRVRSNILQNIPRAKFSVEESNLLKIYINKFHQVYYQLFDDDQDEDGDLDPTDKEILKYEDLTSNDLSYLWKTSDQNANKVHDVYEDSDDDDYK